VPDGPGTDADQADEFSDPHATRKHLDAATRSNERYLGGTGGMLLAVSIAFSDRTESQ